MNKIDTVSALTDFGRARLSKSFFMRDFLFSDIAAIHGMSNVPEDPDLAIEAGTKLCEELLEPLQDRFGRIAIRSAYRSSEVNAFGNRMQSAGKKDYTCAANEKNFASHIWDRRDPQGRMGATACIVIPSFWDAFQNAGDWQKLAWWIHDHLPYSKLYFFSRFWACNVTWREEPARIIKSYATPKGCLTQPGMSNHLGSHESLWRGIERAMVSSYGSSAAA
jgi:hypothetical protein